MHESTSDDRNTPASARTRKRKSSGSPRYSGDVPGAGYSIASKDDKSLDKSDCARSAKENSSNPVPRKRRSTFTKDSGQQQFPEHAVVACCKCSSSVLLYTVRCAKCSSSGACRGSAQGDGDAEALAVGGLLGLTQAKDDSDQQHEAHVQASDALGGIVQGRGQAAATAAAAEAGVVRDMERRIKALTARVAEQDARLQHEAQEKKYLRSALDKYALLAREMLNKMGAAEMSYQGVKAQLERSQQEAAARAQAVVAMGQELDLRSSEVSRLQAVGTRLAAELAAKAEQLGTSQQEASAARMCVERMLLMMAAMQQMKAFDPQELGSWLQQQQRSGAPGLAVKGGDAGPSGAAAAAAMVEAMQRAAPSPRHQPRSPQGSGRANTPTHSHGPSAHTVQGAGGAVQQLPLADAEATAATSSAGGAHLEQQEGVQQRGPIKYSRSLSLSALVERGAPAVRETAAAQAEAAGGSEGAADGGDAPPRLATTITAGHGEPPASVPRVITPVDCN